MTTLRYANGEGVLLGDRVSFENEREGYVWTVERIERMSVYCDSEATWCEASSAVLVSRATPEAPAPEAAPQRVHNWPGHVGPGTPCSRCGLAFGASTGPYCERLHAERSKPATVGPERSKPAAEPPDYVEHKWAAGGQEKCLACGGCLWPRVDDYVWDNGAGKCTRLLVGDLIPSCAGKGAEPEPVPAIVQKARAHEGVYAPRTEPAPERLKYYRERLTADAEAAIDARHIANAQWLRDTTPREPQTWDEWSDDICKPAEVAGLRCVVVRRG